MTLLNFRLSRSPIVAWTPLSMSSFPRSSAHLLTSFRNWQVQIKIEFLKIENCNVRTLQKKWKIVFLEMQNNLLPWRSGGFLRVNNWIRLISLVYISRTKWVSKASNNIQIQVSEGRMWPVAFREMPLSQFLYNRRKRVLKV